MHSYFDLRSLLRSRIADSLAPAEDCLTILGGDFNWVTTDGDRTALSTMAPPSGARDARDENHVKAVLGDRFGLAEMYQPEHAHASSSARSRLDRIYVNYHPSEHVDRHVRGSALEWRRDLSHHRVVFFTKCTPRHGDEDVRPLNASSLAAHAFPRRVAL